MRSELAAFLLTFFLLILTTSSVITFEISSNYFDAQILEESNKGSSGARESGENDFQILESTASVSIQFTDSDGEGNIVVYGWYTGDFSLGEYVFVTVDDYDTRMFVAKFSPTLELIWAKQYHPTGQSHIADLAVSDIGDIYVSGHFLGEEILLDGVIYSGNASSYSKFIMKLTPNGDVDWVDLNPGWGTLHISIGSDSILNVYGSINVGSAGNLTLGEYILEPPFDSFFGVTFIGKISSTGTWITAQDIQFHDPPSFGFGIDHHIRLPDSVIFFGKTDANFSLGGNEFVCNLVFCAFTLKWSNDGVLSIIEFQSIDQNRSFYVNSGLQMSDGNLLLGGKMGMEFEWYSEYSNEYYTSIHYDCIAYGIFSLDGELIDSLRCDNLDEAPTLENGFAGEIRDFLQIDDNRVMFVAFIIEEFNISGNTYSGQENKVTIWFGDLQIQPDLEISWATSSSIIGFPLSIHPKGDNSLTMWVDVRFDSYFGNGSVFTQRDASQTAGLILNLADTDDIDQDGIPLQDDLCPAGLGGWFSNQTTDFDGDGCKDQFEDDDDDNDGCLNQVDDFPRDIAECLDTDSDGLGDNADLDDDGDGFVDLLDSFPKDAAAWNDTDNDGFPDDLKHGIFTLLLVDNDDDGDNISDENDSFPKDPTEWSDLDSDGVGDNSDYCIGTYGTSTVDRIGCLDQDGDGVSDLNDLDPYNAEIGLDEYDGPRLDVDEEKETNLSTDQTDMASESDGGVVLFSVIGVFIVAGIIIFVRSRRSSVDEEEEEYGEADESYRNVTTTPVTSSDEPSSKNIPDFSLSGSQHESGYEVLEYPEGSEQWWWKDTENQCWVIWE